MSALLNLENILTECSNCKLRRDFGVIEMQDCKKQKDVFVKVINQVKKDYKEFVIKHYAMICNSHLNSALKGQDAS